MITHIVNDSQSTDVKDVSTIDLEFENNVTLSNNFTKKKTNQKSDIPIIFLTKEDDSKVIQFSSDTAN